MSQCLAKERLAAAIARSLATVAFQISPAYDLMFMCLLVNSWDDKLLKVLEIGPRATPIASHSGIVPFSAPALSEKNAVTKPPIPNAAGQR